ncbi:MAG: CoA activase [Deltaproteobacteria bacterium]|nr:CoA activase [Deltaproteobacteria bacterium]
MDDSFRILGIDVGSVSLSVAEISLKRDICKTAYRFHHGDIRETLRKTLEDFDLGRIRGVAATSSTPSLLRADGRYDNRVAIMEAARHFHRQIGAILVVGGEAFGLIGFDERGNYRSYRTNTSCAAGTGSFLDQQARRLGLESTEALSENAFSNRGKVPKIASRCAVFAKTDLVHAQQEGYDLEQICDGLCYGLAKNIVDTLSMDREVREPILFTGGVSKNRAVVRHIEAVVGKQVLVDETGMYGAIGAAFLFAGEGAGEQVAPIGSAEDLLVRETIQKKYFHDPLELTLSPYPEFGGIETYEYMPPDVPFPYPVEVDIYEALEPGSEYEVYLGVDIGSTSTKAVLMEECGRVLAGVYTCTAGRPVAAVQRVFSSVDNLVKKKAIGWRVLGAGTTGSGRKFAGRIIGADVVIDEITAHARAACEIDPDVDTIIEIGGQDSKFTTLKNGRVTFSIMNNVCAAGTGSFIEEQARKLGCPLGEYSSRAEGRRSPIVSDRCTVFMERDMNQYLSEGYAVDEVLASVVHAVRENYLTKVAVESGIGKRVTFQGATAKNRALVAAFEQRLHRAIHVSRYCHLTGALGVALTMSDQGIRASSFRGIALHKKTIRVTSETCELCTNHCKISVADLGGEKVAYGFLCGRDYDTGRYVEKNLSGFDLLKERKKVYSFDPARGYGEEITIGIPAALHVFEDLAFWRRFFAELSIRTVTSEGCTDALKEGKHIAGAEFCAPMAALHGHVDYLKGRADYVFLPFYLEKQAGEKGVRRQYCYYTQFAPSLISTQDKRGDGKRFLTPLVHSLHGSFHTKIELASMLKTVARPPIGFLNVSRAYETAQKFRESCREKWRNTYDRESGGLGRIHVVLLGRPYTVLSRRMNKGIPDIFASLGIRVFFQDMLSLSRKDVAPIRELLNEVHWHYASEILKAAQVVARSKGAYPVLVTSFRCSPDSFAIDYFKRIMEGHEKPYLILQLDEHESSVGYETRIEAAVRSFENHYCSAGTGRKVAVHRPTLLPVREKELAGRTLVIPNWDDITLRLMVANLQREGIDARLMEESETGIRKSLRHNTGQCIPLNIIAQEFVDYVKTHDLDPARTLLWMVSSKIPCNIGLFPLHLKRLIHSRGEGMEKAGVYAGTMSFIELSLRLPINTYFAYMFGGFIRKIVCRIRPYERRKGATDKVLRESMEILVDAFLGERSKEDALAEVIPRFEAIEASCEQRPKVAIFGDLYVRDNDVMNQDLVRFIERHNGEVIVTPYSSYVQMIAGAYLRKWFFEGRYLDILSSKALLSAVTRLERTYHKYFGRILENPAPDYDKSPEDILSEYRVRIEHTGESMDNLLKVFYIKRHYPDVSLFVQTSPAFCCPSLVTEAMAREIEKRTGVPVVSITYDGTSAGKNEAVVPYLDHLNRGKGRMKQ